MIEVLYNKLGSINDNSLAELIDIDMAVYNKHSQAPRIPKATQNKEAYSNKSPSHTSHTPLTPHTSPKVPDSIAVEPPREQIQHKVLYKNEDKVNTTTKGKKNVIIKPLDVITRETDIFNTSTEYIKESLIKLISKEEFSKVFGLTKCAEIMSGIVNNRWNKSTALFISFLFDKEIYYNDKKILYNKDKNEGLITV